MTDSTRRLYDTVANTYARVLPDLRAETPSDLDLIARFAAIVPAGQSPVLDAGCGTGRMLPHLASLGLRPLAGVDLSPAMVAHARQRAPEARIDVAPLSALPFPDAGVRGILCWYAIIHSTTDEIAAVAKEAARVLVDGGPLLLAFQAGTGDRVVPRVYGHDVTLRAVLHEPDDVAATLEGAGFAIVTTARRDALPQEKHAQGFVLARHDPTATGSAP
ncbi:class I SAM-dependent DNA methyltransferase [Microbacterium sp. IEGM 1404]|uniref:class I SAM-dependent DNA methyltransferase n=1 Tax=Microbacterium sp. IEGM 1404 TaxID=3047084 RepID=UPI0024B7016A|nr:class I SAM-dependent methyltransferase [Microbacterium sp. IEGM 1404]MDI9892297.1 methyltransferase domain-containing protein [Microbacterium sp. IEGM 1404]